MRSLSKPLNALAWAAALLAAGILAMASFFKLTGAPDSVQLFETLGAEPWGRYLVGLLELTAVILLVRPATAAKGAALALFLMLGALGTHLFKIGINYQGDGGTLFGMALGVLIASALVARLRGL